VDNVVDKNKKAQYFQVGSAVMNPPADVNINRKAMGKNNVIVSCERFTHPSRSVYDNSALFTIRIRKWLIIHLIPGSVVSGYILQR